MARRRGVVAVLAATSVLALAATAPAQWWSDYEDREIQYIPAGYYSTDAADTDETWFYDYYDEWNVVEGDDEIQSADRYEDETYPGVGFYGYYDEDDTGNDWYYDYYQTEWDNMTTTSDLEESARPYRPWYE